MSSYNGIELDSFTVAYIEAALWSSTIISNLDGSNEEDCDFTDDCSYESAGFGIDDICKETLLQMKADCEAFQEENEFWLEQAGTEEQNGHDFWLTRNHHGAGFWGRGYDHGVGNELTWVSHREGSIDLVLFRDVETGNLFIRAY